MGLLHRRPGSHVKDLSVEELAGVLGSAQEPYLLDVRQPDEVAAWSIPGVVNIPLGELPQRLAELPDGRRIVTVCASGNRSSQAALLLGARGYGVANLSGGMKAWAHLYDTAVVDVAGIEVVQVRRRGKGCLSYLVGAGDEAFVIDPAVHVDRYLAEARHRGWRITRVFDTHLHADHLSGARALAHEAKAILHLSGRDAFDFPFTPLADDDAFPLPGGAHLSVAPVATPGHTQGSTVFVLGGADRGAVFSGDTLFIDSVGRPDLAERAEEFARNLYRSLHDHVLTLPDETLVLPSHYGPSVPVTAGVAVAATLGELRATLAPLGYDEEAFVAWAVANVAERPPNYRDIVRANMAGAHTGAHRAELLEAGPNRCAV
jgi:glyoxylase-like metal-dependent hydrolase (beta-lactamase superfamily II)